MARAFGAGECVAVVPGGLAEMRESRSDGDAVVLVRRHKGFVRVALQHGVPLVPVFVFGERHIMDNIRWPSVQQWFSRVVGFGFPHFPHGVLGLPVPRAAPLTVAVGVPLECPRIPHPTEAEIEHWHAKYFAALAELFETHAAAHHGRPERHLLFREGIAQEPRLWDADRNSRRRA
eukprot:TRINITY_DN719_c0_g1_i5.p2 TRINITY_DN719_c0_g1~~TRINITY_DN719_c0_g1_i5.p2  ORF type:complete len:176 (+),score=40.81 TRINITY_DN719_c0_g1_i5:206-733(+)